MKTSPKKIHAICDENDVRLSKKKEQGRWVYGLHGFLANIQAVEREIEGYWIEQRDSGHYLYREDLLWD